MGCVQSVRQHTCCLMRMSNFCLVDAEVPPTLAALLLAPSSSELRCQHHITEACNTAQLDGLSNTLAARRSQTERHIKVATCRTARPAWVLWIVQAPRLANQGVQLQWANRGHPAGPWAAAVLQLSAPESASDIEATKLHVSIMSCNAHGEPMVMILC